jgi:hypothetical protein
VIRNWTRNSGLAQLLAKILRDVRLGRAQLQALM